MTAPSENLYNRVSLVAPKTIKIGLKFTIFRACFDGTQEPYQANNHQ
jgi:hypothetical protein